MARPQKKLDEKQTAQVEALASVLTLEQIADYFGVNSCWNWGMLLYGISILLIISL